MAYNLFQYIASKPMSRQLDIVSPECRHQLLNLTPLTLRKQPLQKSPNIARRNFQLFPPHFHKNIPHKRFLGILIFPLILLKLLSDFVEKFLVFSGEEAKWILGPVVKESISFLVF